MTTGRISTTLVAHGQVDALWPQALALSRQGRHRLARALLQQLLAVDPAHADALNLLGVAEASLGRWDQALAACDRAIALQPGRADLHANRAQTLAALGRHDEAAEACERALAATGDLPRDTLWALAQMLLRQRRDLPALACCERMLAGRADDGDALNGAGIALRRLGRQAEALARFDHLVRAQPGFASGHANRANTLGDLGRHAEALAGYEQTLALQPDRHDARVYAVAAMVRLGRFEDALRAAEAVPAGGPQHAEALKARGAALHALERDEEALVAYRQSLLGRPDDAGLHANLGAVLTALMRHDEADAAYAQALALAPDHAPAVFGRSLLQLLTGDFDAGWRGYEARWRNPELNPKPVAPQPPWLGDTPLNGRRVLLHAEQGLGDAIQFVRFVERVRAAGAGHIALVVPAALLPLVKSVGADVVLPGGSPLPPFDVHVPLMSLPLAFGTRLDTIPANGPYLRADAARRAVWEGWWGERPGRPRVGVVWAGNPRHWNDRRRSMRLATFLEGLTDAAAQLVSLQKEVPEADHSLLAGRRDIAAPALGELADTAALIDTLDLVITVDTAVAHLAGAMGKPVWLLLPRVPDWRWLLDRDDSPWYPTVRLFRQTTAGDWAGVLRRVAAELRLL